MRVLVTTVSAVGHVLPMAPVAAALRASGHDVIWATGADSAEWVRRTGVEHVPAGPSQPELVRHMRHCRQGLGEVAPEAVPDVVFGTLFGERVAPVMLADLWSLVAGWTPELVLHDAAEFAGPIVAASVGAPNVVTSFGPLLPRPRVAGAGEAVAPLWNAAGLAPRPFGGCYDHLYLDIYPPIFQPELPAYIPRRQLLRPVHAGLADTGRGDGAFWADGVNRPLVYVTMGTVFNEPTGLRRVVDAVAGLDVRILVTVGPAGDPDTLGEQPPHVRVERYVPQQAILGECAAVVSHGGSGTVLGALAYGVPQLCLPQGADQFLNANAVSGAGAGLALQPTAADPDAIRASVARLLTGDSFRGPAQAAAVSISAMPGPDDVAVVLEQLPRRVLTTAESRLLWVSHSDTDYSRSGNRSLPARGRSKADAAPETE